MTSGLSRARGSEVSISATAMLAWYEDAGALKTVKSDLSNTPLLPWTEE